jgi:hypothetical protein
MASLYDKYLQLEVIKNQFKNEKLFNLEHCYEKVKESKNDILEWCLKKIIIEKNCHKSIVWFIEKMCLNPLFKFLIENNKIEIETNNQDEFSYNCLIKILEPSSKPFDALSISFSPDRNGFANSYSNPSAYCLEVALMNYSNKDLVYLEAIGYKDVRCFDMEIFRKNDLYQQKLFFLQIFSLIYFSCEELETLSKSNPSKEFVFEPIEKLPQEILLLEYFKKTTGETKEEVENCAIFFANKLNDFLEKEKKNIKKEVLLTPIIWCETLQSFLFQIETFVSRKNQVETKIYFQYEFTIDKKEILLTSNKFECFSNKISKERLNLNVDKIISKLYADLLAINLID